MSILRVCDGCSTVIKDTDQFYSVLISNVNYNRREDEMNEEFHLCKNCHERLHISFLYGLLERKMAEKAIEKANSINNKEEYDVEIEKVNSIGIKEEEDDGR